MLAVSTRKKIESAIADLEDVRETTVYLSTEVAKSARVVHAALKLTAVGEGQWPNAIRHHNMNPRSIPEEGTVVHVQRSVRFRDVGEQTELIVAAEDPALDEIERDPDPGTMQAAILPQEQRRVAGSTAATASSVVAALLPEDGTEIQRIMKGYPAKRRVPSCPKCGRLRKGHPRGYCPVKN